MRGDAWHCHQTAACDHAGSSFRTTSLTSTKQPLSRTITMGLDFHLDFFKGIFLLIVAYAVTLQLTDPWTDFPFSSAAKESLKLQAHFLVNWASLTSTVYMMVFIFLISLMLFVRTAIRMKMRFSPAFKANVEERRAARLARTRARREAATNAIHHLETSTTDSVQNQPCRHMRSARSVWTEVAVCFVIGTACILNDAIYNRPEGYAVFEGALTRFSYNAAWCAMAVGIELAVFSVFLAIAVAVKVRRARRGQIELDGDEELRVGLVSQVTEGVPKGPVTLSAGLDEKLIDIEDDMEKFQKR
ncbi:hypothetical protein D9758_014479 [Tetrapyrgos nigripes]|uniref:Uncharacterized protein n=1 Tax=Tetrapyrgos nigripes TaxID=182062 RepID=A0A8H5FH27_9AGAR|nr:hypothetical protein D9758_014479 [Tetrapyrgos nigripes]